MTTQSIIQQFPFLTASIITSAFNEVKRKLALPPVVFGVTVVNARKKSLIGLMQVDSDYLEIKEVKELDAAEVTYVESDIETVEAGLSSFVASRTPVTKTGLIYFNNNTVTAASAKFNMTCYVYPRMVGDNIPGYMLLPVIAEAMSIHAMNSDDVQAHAQYQDIAYKLINYLNESYSKLLPKGFSGLMEVTGGNI